MKTETSIIIPAKNELAGIKRILPSIKELYPDAEIILVDDGSTDGTKEYCEEIDVRCVKHVYSKGNGAAIKTGAKNASGEVLVFLDADGQHSPEDIKKLLGRLDAGYDMVVAARAKESHASILRYIANSIYNKLASWMAGHNIEDLTSGFRAVKADKFREYLYLLPNGFSYPSTITMAFFRSGYSVEYIRIDVEKRIGKSHIKPIRDFLRFFLIIFRVATLYSPLKIFFFFSLICFITGMANYLYTYIYYKWFIKMSFLLLSMSILIFLIGLISEQVTMLIYKKNN